MNFVYPFLCTWSPSSTVPGAPPQDVQGEAITSRSIRVHWQPPPPNQQNGLLSHYKIRYVPLSEASSPPEEVVVTDPQQLSYVLDGLKKWTEYKIWVLASTVVGDGPPSPPVIVRTDEDGTYDAHLRRLSPFL